MQTQAWQQCDAGLHLTCQLGHLHEGSCVGIRTEHSLQQQSASVKTQLHHYRYAIAQTIVLCRIVGTAACV